MLLFSMESWDIGAVAVLRGIQSPPDTSNPETGHGLGRPCGAARNL